VLTARRTIGLGSQSGLTKHRVDRVGRVDLSNTYRVILGLLVMGLGLGLSLWGCMVGHSPATAGLLVTFRIVFHIFVDSEHRDFKFSLRVDHSKSQPTDDKLSLRGAWLRHVTHFKFLVHLKYIRKDL